jgi:hypothetical protein
MAAKKRNPAARRAQKNARRAARKRNGTHTGRMPRPRYLYDLEPPGVFYEDWDRPTGSDDEVMAKVTTAFGADSDEALTMRFMLEYRKTYGPHVPLVAAHHLDEILAQSDLTSQLIDSMGGTPETIRETVHSLHAQGMLLIDDDGALWLTVPPGTPHSAPDGQWTFVERKVEAPVHSDS